MTDLHIWLWLALATFGLYLAHLNGTEAIRDYQALGGKTNGRRTIAIGSVRREVVRGLIQADFIILGALALLNVHAPIVFISGLFLASAGMNLNSYLDRRDRLYLTRYGLQPRDEAGRFVKE